MSENHFSKRGVLRNYPRFLISFLTIDKQILGKMIFETGKFAEYFRGISNYHHTILI